ncbi:MAG: GNAT family N-acetyltransferase [Roseibium sp.]|nr:GNAT family N-acetyltransferase [Roseibium sp.]
MTLTLETDRLRLRRMTMEDWPDYSALMQSDRARYMGGPKSEADSWGMFCHDAAQWALMGHGALMIEDKASRACLGQVGVNHGPLFPEHELGWFLYEGAEGRGYALEAARAMRAWALGERGLKTLVSYIDPDNEKSRLLAERLGAVPDPDAPRPASDDLVYRHA